MGLYIFRGTVDLVMGEEVEVFVFFLWKERIVNCELSRGINQSSALRRSVHLRVRASWAALICSVWVLSQFAAGWLQIWQG